MINLLKLSAFLFGGVLYFFGLGLAVLIPFTNRFKVKNVVYWSDILPISLVFGLVLNYGLTLIFQHLSVGLSIGAILSLGGIIYFLYDLRYKKYFIGSNKKTDFYLGVLFFSLFFLVPILTLPITDWDARSIWFFHAKMIYFGNTIGLDAGWQHLSVNFSHPDYPKLVPLVAGQIAYIVGFWNEYLPKLALFMVLFPALIWLFRLAKMKVSFFILLILMPLSFHKLMWNGYMDGFLALYFSVSLLFLGRYVKKNSLVDIASSLVAAFFLLYLKNEGLLAFTIIIVSVLILAVKNNLIKTLSNTRFSVNISIAIIALFPFFMWIYHKSQWGISNDLGFGTVESFSRLLDRFVSGEYVLIFEAAYKSLELGIMLLFVLIVAMTIWKEKLPRHIYPIIFSGLFYFFGMAMVYMLTPHDLSWHLSSSIGRTMLPVSGALYVLVYFLYAEIEERWNSE